MEMSDFQDVYIDKIDVKSAFSGQLPNDEPILKELGIDFEAIFDETKLIINPHAQLEKSDVTGPIIFIILYSLLLLLNGKVHFGYIYFITLFSNMMICFLLNVLKNTSKKIELIKCFSVLGYSFLPIVVFAFLSIFLSFIKIPLAIMALFWSTYVASVIFCSYLELYEKRFIVGYPIMLVYVCYILLVIF